MVRYVEVPLMVRLPSLIKHIDLIGVWFGENKEHH